MPEYQQQRWLIMTLDEFLKSKQLLTTNERRLVIDTWIAAYNTFESASNASPLVFEQRGAITVTCPLCRGKHELKSPRLF